MKKISTLVIVVLMLFVTACGASQENTLLAFINDDENSKTDFGDYTIHIYLPPDDEEDDVTLFGYDSNTLQYEVLSERINQIQTDCNCTVEINNLIDREPCKLRLMSGSFDADLVKYSGFNALQDWAQAGLLLPMTDFTDIIDLSDSAKYGSANVLEAAMIDKVPYAVQPVYWPGHDPLDCFVFVYNKPLFSSNGLTDLHEYYENGTWTWDTFKSFIDTTDISVGGENIPLFMTKNGHLFTMLLYSNGVQYVKKNADGTFVADPYSVNFTNAFQWGMDFVSEYGDKIYLIDAFWDIDDYLYGNVLTALTTAKTVTSGDVAYNDKGNFESGIMPFPSGPNAEYGHWAQSIDRSYGFGIPVCSAEPEIAANFISMMFEPFEEFGGSAGLLSYYEKYVFSDSVDAEIFMELGKYARYNYEFSGGSDLMRSVNNYFGDCLQGTKSVAQCMDAYKDTLTSIIEKYMLTNYEYVYDNFYSKQG